MFGKTFRIKSTAALGKHVAVEGILNFDSTKNGKIYIDGSQLTGTEITFLDGVTAGTGVASKAFVADAYKAFRMGGWAAAGAAGTAVVFAATHNFWSDGQLDLFSVFGTSTSDLTSAYSAKCGRFRHLATGSSITVSQETYGLIGQICAKGSTLTHIHGGLMGTFEGTGASVVLNSSYTMGGHGCVIARPGGHTNITATTPLAGFLAFNNGSAALTSGKLVAFLTSAASVTYPWIYGMYMPVGSITTGIRIGDWVGSGSSGSAIAFSTAQNLYADGQLDIVGVYGESTSNLTSAYSAKCGRFRHIATGSSITVAQETYGLIGQMCAKGATLTHLHSGLIGTFEGTGAAVVLNSSYTTGGHSCVMARVGGHANITCTTPLYGFLAWNNASATVASGTLAAFGTAVASASYQWPIGLYIPSGSCTLPINVTSSVMGADGRIAKLYGSCAAAAMSDGYGAVEIDLTITGTSAGTNHSASALSAWVNIPSGTASSGKYVCAQNNGVYEDSGAIITGAKVVYGMRAQKILGDTDAVSFAFSLNMNSVAHTAIFEAPTTTDMGAVAGAAATGGFKIPFLRDYGGTIYYMNLYTS